MKYAAWDYEESASPPYYHIYIHNGPLDTDENDTCFGFVLPKTPENSGDIQLIVDALDRLSSRVATTQELKK